MSFSSAAPLEGPEKALKSCRYEMKTDYKIIYFVETRTFPCRTVSVEKSSEEEKMKVAAASFTCVQ